MTDSNEWFSLKTPRWNVHIGEPFIQFRLNEDGQETRRSFRGVWIQLDVPARSLEDAIEIIRQLVDEVESQNMPFVTGLEPRLGGPDVYGEDE